MRVLHRLSIEAMLCLAVVTALPFLACWRGVFRNEVPLSTDAALFTPPWQEARPAGLAPPEDPAAVAETQHIYPSYVFLHEAVRRDESLLWNPYERCGAPFFALWQSRCLSLFSVPFYVFPPSAALKLSMFLKVLLAGWCAFYAARKMGFAPSIALMIAGAFQLSGHLLLWPAWPVSDAVPFLPLLLVFSERLALGQIHYWPYGTLTLALVLLASGPLPFAMVLVFMGLFLAYRRMFGQKHGDGLLPSVYGLALAGVFAIGLSAFQALPAVEWMRQTVGDWVESFGFLRISDLAAAFFPSFFGKGPGAVVHSGVAASLRVPRLLHVGIAQILFVLLWFALRPATSKMHRQRIDAMFAASATLAAMALVLSRWTAGSALFGALDPVYLLMPNALVCAFVAGAAAEEWTELGPEDCLTSVKRFVLLVGAGAVLVAGLVLFRRNDDGANAPTFVQQALLAGVPAVLTLAAITATVLRPSLRLLGYGTFAVTVFNLMVAFDGAIDYTPADRVFPETRFISRLKDEDGRIGGSETLGQWPLAGSLVAQVRGTGARHLKRHQTFMGRVGEDPRLLRRAGCPALVLTGQDLACRYGPMRPTLRLDEVFASGAALFEDPEAHSRVRMVYDFRPVLAFNAALLDSQGPPLIETERAPVGEGPEERSVIAIEAETHTQIRIRAEVAGAGVLVLADTWYPDWKAEVDGQDTPVFPVDRAFRGVWLEAGGHDVLFSYKPRSVEAGLYISAVAGVIVVFAGAVLLVQRLRMRRKRY